jgi:CheY-like chemotaxis protein
LNVTAVTVETRDHGANAADCGPVGVPLEISLGSSSGESIAFLFRGLCGRFQMKDLRPHLDIGAHFSAETLRPMSKIVIHEADDLMRGLLKEWLTGAGYRVGAATLCGPPCLEADLVIVNIGMPKHAGSRVTDEIRATHPKTPIIAISAQFRADLSTAGTTAQSLGVAQVIAKPLTRDTLLAAVRAIIDPAPH